MIVQNLEIENGGGIEKYPFAEISAGLSPFTLVIEPRPGFAGSKEHAGGDQVIILRIEPNLTERNSYTGFRPLQNDYEEIVPIDPGDDFVFVKVGWENVISDDERFTINIFGQGDN